MGNERIWPEVESNHRHADFQSAALPTELPGHRRERDRVLERSPPGASRRTPHRRSRCPGARTLHLRLPADTLRLTAVALQRGGGRAVLACPVPRIRSRLSLSREAHPRKPGDVRIREFATGYTLWWRRYGSSAHMRLEPGRNCRAVAARDRPRPCSESLAPWFIRTARDVSI